MMGAFYQFRIPSLDLAKDSKYDMDMVSCM